MSYTPFKMAPKGPIMKKYHSAMPKRNKAEAKVDAVDGGMPSEVADKVFAKKGKSPYEYEKNSKDFVDRKNKEEVNKVKSKTSAHGQLNDAEEEARNDIKLKNKKTNQGNFVPAYPGADISEAEYKKRLKSGSTKRD